MRLIRCGRDVLPGWRTLTNNENKRPAKAAGRRLPLGGILAVFLLAGLGIESTLHARQNAAVADSTSSVAKAIPKDQLAAVKLEMTNALQQVLKIVNRPVKAYVQSGDISASTYQPGWFHQGASKPDFNTVDVRQGQELPYAEHKFVTSDLNPGIVFLGQDLEFNAMTKYFYTNRTLPKAKLTEAEMLEINRLYRIIGRCEEEIARSQTPPATETAQPANADSGTEEIVPGQSFESIRKIPRQTRVLYATIAIGG